MKLQQSDIKCEQAALKLVAMRSLSVAELGQRLAYKGYSEENINVVIDNFSRLGYLDDVKLCQSLYNKYLKSGKYGIRAIVSLLKKRELPASVIADVIDDYDRTQEVAQAITLIQRRFTTTNAPPPAKISRYLASHGFTTDTIVKVLEEFSNYCE